MIEQLQGGDLQAWLDDKSRAKPVVLDVREPWEHEVCSIPDSMLLPMQQIPTRLQELPTDADIVVVCHHGMRSADATAFLSQQGFKSVKNLVGGIDAWSKQIDPGVPRY